MLRHFRNSAEAFPKKDSSAYAPPVFQVNAKCQTGFKKHNGKEITLIAGAVDVQKSRQAVLCGIALAHVFMPKDRLSFLFCSAFGG